MTGSTDLDAVGRTSLVTAAMRAAETARPDAIHRDPYAAALAGDLGRALLDELLAAAREAGPGAGRGAKAAPGAGRGAGPGAGRLDVNAVRTRYFDEYLHAAARESGVRQIVVAGAGMDSRAYRMDWPDGVRYFEIDRPAVLDHKRERLRGATPAADRRPVPVDLASPSWPAALTAAGYDPGSPSAWLMEGLLNYVPEPGVHRLLSQVAGLTAPGSGVAADLVSAAALTLPDRRPLLDVFAGWGCPWLFGCDTPEDLFGQHGFEAVATQPGDPAASFGRMPAPAPRRDAPAGAYRVFLVTGRRVRA